MTARVVIHLMNDVRDRLAIEQDLEVVAVGDDRCHLPRVGFDQGMVAPWRTSRMVRAPAHAIEGPHLVAQGRAVDLREVSPGCVGPEFGAKELVGVALVVYPSLDP